MVPQTSTPRRQKSPAPLTEATATFVEEQLPFVLCEPTYHRFRQCGLSKGELRTAVNTLVQTGKARLEMGEGGVHVYQNHPQKEQ